VNKPVTPFSLKDAPSLIEHLFPVQKLSAEAYKEQMAGSGKTLTALGSYWKGRKPLVLAKACILGSLVPATEDPARDLEIFEKLMAMDDESFVIRWKRRPKPKEVLGTLSIANIADYFTMEPEGILPAVAPVDWSNPAYDDVKVTWRADLTEMERRRIEAQILPKTPYRERVGQAQRPEEVMDTVHDHIWDAVNAHLGTSAQSFPELIEHLGIMRYGHRPQVADTFCGSGQIPFEAARLGCDVCASDLNPIACMLTWGAFHIVGGAKESREKLAVEQEDLMHGVQTEIEALDVESDGKGWHAKVYLYCLETRCPGSKWMVPLLPTLIVSKGYRVVADLVPDEKTRRYDIRIRSNVSDAELAAAEQGTVRTDGPGQDPYVIHAVAGREYRTKISTLRGDFRNSDGSTGNKLRVWEQSDFKPRDNDIYQDRLYCVQWMRPKAKRKGDDYEFRAPTDDEMRRERSVETFVAEHLVEWQAKGWLPDMRIEPGDKTDEPIRTRGWTHWHHLWNPRHLMSLGLIMKRVTNPSLAVLFASVLDFSSKLSRWETTAARMSKDGSGKQVGGASNNTKNVFYNQALNPLLNYGCRSTSELFAVVRKAVKHSPVSHNTTVCCAPASELSVQHDLYITDPPYGDAVNYEEILDFFIAWLRKNPPPEFADWVWDSRRALAIKGEDENFRREMVAAYKKMTGYMPDNGIQVIMFTHQSGGIWADMANIVWASGLRVTAAWYVVTETESALRQGNNVKGTVLLVLRKRAGTLKTNRDDLAWEIQEEVEKQVRDLTGLNQEAKGLYRDENVFEDADLQMAGYAAALRVLTRYATIDGRDMTVEAIRPRVKGEITFVDTLIAFAVDTANQCLAPQDIPSAHWDKLTGGERFYLKLLDLEAKGFKILDNYQNFAKAFKVRNFHALMASDRANAARLKSAVEFGKTEMAEGSELYQSVLRASLYALMELVRNVDGGEVLAHLTFNVTDYYSNQNQRDLVVGLTGYLANKLETIRPEEASAARVLRDLVKNQRLG
jgi:putative DNA methylase